VAGEEVSAPAAGRLVKKVKHHRPVKANRPALRVDRKMVLPADLVLRLGASAGLAHPEASVLRAEDVAAPVA
jgi:hypothetical protein